MSCYVLVPANSLDRDPSSTDAQASLTGAVTFWLNEKKSFQADIFAFIFIDSSKLDWGRKVSIEWELFHAFVKSTSSSTFQNPMKASGNQKNILWGNKKVKNLLQISSTQSSHQDMRNCAPCPSMTFFAFLSFGKLTAWWDCPCKPSKQKQIKLTSKEIPGFYWY